MQPFLFLWTVVAAAGVVLSAPLGESLAAAEYAVASGVSPLGKRALWGGRASVVRDVAQCIWEGDSMDTCIELHKAEKYRPSSKELRSRYLKICKRQRGISLVECEKYARVDFWDDDGQRPSRLERFAKMIDHRVEATGRAVVRGAKRIGSGGRAVAKSILNRPSAFQNSVREKEGVGALHPIGPIRIPE
ncbi:MAG: hypothetical protein M1826_001822 [Phylliscum demangeonii]|nr:MAG: hypothetical protein M1826_001822 [Phylliscum demangeonii]